MAKRGGQPGNDGGAKDKLITEALRVAALRPCKTDPQARKNLYVIADKLIEKAVECKPWAVKEVLDRLEGKPAQSVSVTSESPAEDLETVDITSALATLRAFVAAAEGTDSGTGKGSVH